jgi:hypothetical protein
MDPSMASRLLHTTPALGGTLRAFPLTTGLLNNVKLSPGAREGPKFVTLTEPTPVLLSVPETTTKSFDGEADLSTSTATLPATAAAEGSVSAGR